MTPDSMRALREQAYLDFESASGVCCWNTPCEHGYDIEFVKSEFVALTRSSNWERLSFEEKLRVYKILRCCLRLVPNWQRLIPEAVDACFVHPDALTRGLLLRSVIHVWSMPQFFPVEAKAIHQRVAARMPADDEQVALMSAHTLLWTLT